jgi:hypothetical protein
MAQPDQGLHGQLRTVPPSFFALRSPRLDLGGPRRDDDFGDGDEDRPAEPERPPPLAPPAEEAPPDWPHVPGRVDFDRLI